VPRDACPDAIRFLEQRAAASWSADVERRKVRWCSASYTEVVSKPSEADTTHRAVALERALATQASGDEHDVGLIVERLAWTPEQRLEGNAAFLRFYYAVRPTGPFLREE
jgi:hypothetical protein